MESFIESSEKERTVMETVLNSNSTNRHCVNGRELLDIKVSDRGREGEERRGEVDEVDRKEMQKD